MDILGDVLSTLSLEGLLYFRTDFSPPWGCTVPELNNAARFHLVLEGECYIEIENCSSHLLRAGDLILIPKGRSHTLADSPRHINPPLEKVLEKSGYDGKGVLRVGSGDSNARTQMVCGHLNFRENADHVLIQAMPNYILVTPDMRVSNPMLEDVLRLIVKQVFAESEAASATMARLFEIVFIELIRTGVDVNEPLRSLISAFQDPKIGVALSIIHENPAAEMSVASLASDVAMSRSRFAEKFSSMIGVSPMSYLHNWRLQKSMTLLLETHQSIQQVADESGYRSAASFSRAFSEKFGSAPSYFRRKKA